LSSWRPGCGVAAGVGLGVGRGVGRAVGWAVGRAVAAGVGLGVGRGAVGAGVGVAVGGGTGRAVGRVVGRGVGAWVGCAVGRDVGRGVGAGVRPGAFVGPPGVLGVPGPSGVGVWPTAMDGDADVGETEDDGGGTTAMPEGEPTGPGEPLEGAALVDDPPSPTPEADGPTPDAPSPTVDGGTCATTWLGLVDAAARRCTSMPPSPSATVARTRFTRPRARTRRARWLAVTTIRTTPCRTMVRSREGPDGTRPAAHPGAHRMPRW